MILSAIVGGYASPPNPEPMYMVEYINTPQGAVVISVHSAMGERLHAEMHPRFQYWLRNDLAKEGSVA